MVPLPSPLGAQTTKPMEQLESKAEPSHWLANEPYVRDDRQRLLKGDEEEYVRTIGNAGELPTRHDDRALTANAERLRVMLLSLVLLSGLAAFLVRPMPRILTVSFNC